MKNQTTIRCFLAFPIPEDIRTIIWKNIHPILLLMKNSKIVKKENYHITLQFFGELSIQEVEFIIEKLNTLHQFAINTQFEKCGFFPSPYNPKILWMSILDKNEKIKHIYHNITQLMRKDNVDNPDYVYIPHLTLSRLYDKRKQQLAQQKKIIYNIHEKIQKKIKIFPSFVLDNLVLYKSQLTKAGSQYSVLWSQN